ncbi:MAG TPA: hypothetical protein VIV55_02015 [Flavobacterium sp.]
MKKILVLLLFHLLSFSQDKNEAITEPDPYIIKPYYDNINKTKIKKVAIINKSKFNYFNHDTLEVCLYNKSGQRIETIRYDKNLKSTNSKSKFDKNDNQIEFIMEDKNSVTKTTLEYNSLNKIAKIETTDTRNNLLVNTNIQIYEYENKKLKRQKRIINNAITKIETFDYDKDQLSEYKLELFPTRKYITNYIYINNQLTNRRTNRYLTNDSIELWNEKKFIFENYKLIRDEELTYSHVKDSTIIINEYNYNEDTSLKKITSKFGNDFKETQFKYENGKVKKIDVTTNSTSGFLKFKIPYSMGKKDLPAFYEEEFYYDEMNNLTSKKMFLNKVLINELEFKVEYY